MNSGFGNIYLNFKEQLLNIALFIKSHFKIPFRHTELQKAAKKKQQKGYYLHVTVHLDHFKIPFVCLIL